MAAILPILLAFAATVCWVTGLVSLRSGTVRRTAVGRAFIAVAASAGLWAGAISMQLSATSPEVMGLMGILSLAGIVVLSVAWPVFALAYTERTAWLSPAAVGALSILPATLFVASLIPATSDLVITNLEVIDVGSLSTITGDPGPLLLLFVGYTYFLDVVALGVLVLDTARATGDRRRRSRLLTIGGGLPLAVSATSFLDAVAFDLTPVAFAITSVVIGYVVVRYDLTDLDLRAQRHLVDSVGDGYLVADGDGGFVTANETAIEFLDLPSPMPPDLGVADVFADHPDIRAAVTARHGLQTDLVHNDGPDVHVYEATVEPFTAAGVEGTVVILRDVTDARAAEKRAKTLLERASTPVAILAADGRVRYATPAYEDVLGYRPTEREGTNAFSLVHPDDRANVESAFHEAAEELKRVTVEARFRTASGEWVVLESVGDPLFHDPFVQGMVISSRDVTADRQADTRLQVVNRILRHDLRNDSNTITGYVDLLAESSQDPNAERYAGIVRARAQRLLDLGEKARIVDESARNPTQTTINVSKRVRRAISDVTTQYPEVSLSVETETDCVASVTPLVGTAFDNVVENAVCHNEGDTQHVDVSVERDGDQVVVTVADDGPRIPPSERRALRRGRETELEHTSGLGLWLSHWLVQESGGTLSITENDPQGNVVTIRLLAATDTQTSDTADSQESLDSDQVVGATEVSANDGRPGDDAEPNANGGRPADDAEPNANGGHPVDDTG